MSADEVLDLLGGAPETRYNTAASQGMHAELAASWHKIAQRLEEPLAPGKTHGWAVHPRIGVRVAL
jgi:hypothetical protein